MRFMKTQLGGEKAYRGQTQNHSTNFMTNKDLVTTTDNRSILNDLKMN